MIVKSKILEKLRNDNQMSLELALKMDIQQAALFARIDRKSKTFLNDIRLFNFLKSKGFDEKDIFETEPVNN